MIDKPCVTKRNHVTSLRFFVEEILDRYQPDRSFNRQEAHELLMRFGEMLVLHLTSDFAKAAERGISQMAQLIRDPDYYENRQRRKKRQAERQQEYQLKLEREALRRRYYPTRQEIALDLASHGRDLAWHLERVQYHQRRLDELRAAQAELPPEDPELSDCVNLTPQ